MNPAKKTLAIVTAAAAIAALGLALAAMRTPPAEAAIPPPPPASAPVAIPALPPSPPVPPLPPASDTLKVEAALSHGALLQGGNGEAYLNVEISAKDIPGATTRVPVNLAVVIDRSGSMAGAKLQHAKDAATQLVDELGETDRLAIVSYGTDVTVVFISSQATASNKHRMRAAISRIWDSGGTNLSGGLTAGVREVLRGRGAGPSVDRVILISDGQANEGITSRRSLSALSRRHADEGVAISAVGVGLDFNEDVMQEIAEFGNGLYRYMRHPAELAGVFTEELRQSATTVATASVLGVQLPAGVRAAEVYGYPHDQFGAEVRVGLPDFAAGSRRKVVMRLVVPTGAAGTVPVADTRVSYTDLLRDRTGAEARAPQVVAEVTTAPTVVAARQNKHVLEEAVRVNNASALRRAADLFGAGKRDEAQAVLGAQARSARDLNATIGSTGLDAENDEIDRRLQDFQAYGPGDDAGKDLVKASKARAYELAH